MTKPFKPYCFLVFACLIFLFTSCYQEEEITPIFRGETFNFTMALDDEERIFEQMGVQFFVDTPAPVLYLGKHILGVEKFKIRGQNSLNFHKKSFSVSLEEPLKLAHDGGYYFGKKFKLISMVYDYTYIENRVALKLHEAAGIWPLPTFYAEVAINSNHKGLYLFVADPEEYFLNYRNENFILRREYWNGVRRYQQNKKDSKAVEEYTQKYLSVYDIIANKQGVQLYNELSNIINLDAYFTKLTIDFLIRNGDATDEIFFYTKKYGDKELFTPIPWDCDDIFSEFPHEIGREWGLSASVFGPRSYSTMADVIADVGDKLLFSIEEDLDYKIASDPYIYQKYLDQLAKVINIVDEERIRKVFDEVYSEVSVYYDKLDLAELSKYDETPTSSTLLLENIEHKQKLVLNQYQQLKVEIAHEFE